MRKIATPISAGTDRSRLWYTHFLLLAVQITFATLPVSAKIAFRSFSPESIVFFRIAGAGLLFGLIYLIRQYEPVRNLKDLASFAFLAVFGILGNQLFFLKGVSMTKAVNASLLIATIPAFTLLIAGVLGKEKVTWLKIAGVIVSFSGVSLLFPLSDFQLSGYFTGNLLIIINALLYSVFLVCSRPMLERYRPLTVITWVFFCGSVEMLPFTLKAVLAIPYRHLHLQDYLAPLFMVIVGTFIPYILNTMSLRYARSSMVAIYTYLQPLLGTLLAVVILHETLGVRFFVAGFMIFAGITLVSVGRFLPQSSVSSATTDKHTPKSNG